MKIKLILGAVLYLMSFSSLSNPYYQIFVHGVPISCTASNGQQVPFFDDPQSAQAAIQLGGARADFVPGMGYRISLSPQFMNSLSPLGALFTVYHECAHVALPMGVGLNSPMQERNADCYAVQMMQAHGLINNFQQFQSAMSAISKHGVMDINRVNAMAQCL
ncbi:hypothetical protein [Vibrio sp. SCSIO 43137]|uniref:hypothetical protein n=1 Tax=Vibrio sp. SCSIO 43137 TaxID=3021011 RepID=UPI0023071547|nr:hypothetical protein [Vibrio sp. SCSIO 43137]WCE32293.1 hypothetical protein PK654_17505 [Vibrio sp. SCSIO 43137]